MRSLSIAVAAASLAACAVGLDTGKPPAPPQIKGDVPTIGKKLDVNLIGADGEKEQLAFAPGRVTVVCSFENPEALGPCRAVLERFQDRVSVAGVTIVDPAAAPQATPVAATEASAEALPFRIFHDPGGKVLLDKLELPIGPHVLVVDRQGRVRAVLVPTDEEALMRWVGDLAG